MAITTRKFLFNSRRNINTVYAIFSFPKKPGSYPGILVLYGGGSKAEDVASTVEKYARSGYVAMCFDIADSLENSTLFDAEEASEYLNQNNHSITFLMPFHTSQSIVAESSLWLILQ